MIFYDEIYEEALELGLFVPADKQLMFEAACMSASAQLERRLSCTDTDGLEELIVTAGALLAAADYISCDTISGASSCRVGNITVSGSIGGQSVSDALRNQAERLLAPYINDDGFCFRGVMG